jgi:hypothetical protein
MRGWRARVAGCLVGLLAATATGLAADGHEEAAQAAAESWLAGVDAGDYAGSWERAGRLLKASVKQEEWSEGLAATRSPLGAVASRRLKSREATEKPPTTRTIGGRVYTWTAGRYVVVKYDTAFANRASAVETVVAAAEPDGAWRVSSYSVQ